jgi:transcriptional regulator with XRE-family HTH domain
MLIQGGELMDERNNDFDFDFKPIGQAIKKARLAQGMTREQLSRIVDYDPRHLQAVENEGQKPSLELFIQLMTMFDVSVDEYIFPNKEVKKSSVRRRLDAQLDRLDDRELSVIEATVNGLCKAKEPEE